MSDMDEIIRSFWVIEPGSTTPRRATSLADHMAHPRTIENSSVGVAKIGNSEIHTSFLGHNVRLGGDTSGAPPLLFETMVFGGAMDGDCTRYSTWAEALAGHALTCADVQRAEDAAKVWREANL